MQTLSRKIGVLVAGLLLAGSLHGQLPAPEVRIDGLEGNDEYVSLLREDAMLQMREDSIVSAVERMRHRLREEPARGAELTQEILDMENRIFEIRNAKGRIIDRINAIEQDWVLANLDVAMRPAAAEGPAVPRVPDSLQVRNLIFNAVFEEELPEADYAALRRAQALELNAVDNVNRYFANYATLSDLADAYAAAATEQEALDIHGRFKTLEGVNDILSDSLEGMWNYIYDNKSFAYGYLLDKWRQDEMLVREEQRSAEAARRISELQGLTASDAVNDYFLRKRSLVAYETDLAAALGLAAARDSLRVVAAQLETIDFEIPAIAIRERYFIEYDSVAFSKTPVYSYQHPIPECRVYAHGTIYRILLGTFNTKRAAATFRGAYPLCYQIDEAGKWRYFTGGFPTRDEAEAAQKLLKSRGFVRPEIVVWTDGVYRNLSQEPEARQTAYRVEITGAEELSDEVKRVIVETAGESELSRVGLQLFVVGLFDDPALADRVADAVRQTDAALEIKVAEVAR